MRLKGQKQQGRAQKQRGSGGAANSAMTSSDLMNGGGGSSASCSSASAIGAHDDLDNCMDSGDVILDSLKLQTLRTLLRSFILNVYLYLANRTRSTWEQMLTRWALMVNLIDHD